MATTSTRAAEGYARRAFTVDEILRMQDAGIIDESENFELIEGEIVPMNAKMHVHERVKSKLAMALARACPDHLIMGVETSVFLSEHTFLEPDTCLYPEPMRSDDVRGTDIVLAIEVAVATLAYDRGINTQIYARHGVQELWVVDAIAHRTFIHRGPTEKGWTSITEHGPAHVLTIAEVLGFAQSLDTI